MTEVVSVPDEEQVLRVAASEHLELVEADGAVSVIVGEGPGARTYIEEDVEEGVLVDGQGAFPRIAYRHVQSVAAAVWDIAHGLEFWPNVTVVDSAGTVVVGDVEYPSRAMVRISFPGEMAGEAYLS